jgi:pimeloyl-ACP methyl ester carboxylesterase
VTGHSLGGALAQMTAARFPDMVGNVITFQSPGIPRRMAQRVDDFNRQAADRGEQNVPVVSHHYGVDGDLVELAGEAFTSGYRTVIDRPGNYLFRHTSYPVTAFFTDRNPEYQAHGDGQPAAPAEKQKLETTRWRRFVEAVRVGAGHVVDALERVKNLGAAPQRTSYIGVWNQIRDAIDRNATPDEIEAIIQGSSVRDADKRLMLENVRAIRTSQEVAEAATAGLAPMPHLPPGMRFIRELVDKMDWGTTGDDARARAQTITRADATAAGLDLAQAEEWLRYFSSRGPQDPFAGRAALMARVVELLRGAE